MRTIWILLIGVGIGVAVTIVAARLYSPVGRYWIHTNASGEMVLMDTGSGEVWIASLQATLRGQGWERMLNEPSR